jgi:hypothetical protein
VRLSKKEGDLFIASQNRDSLKSFEKTRASGGRLFIPEILDTKIALVYNDGKTQTIELYYGSGFLSQSSRSVRLLPGVKEIIVYNSSGKSRRISVEEIM